MKESYINYFLGKRYPGKELVSIFSILKAFKNGKFKKEIDDCRRYYEAGDIENYQILKGKLKAVTFSGTFLPYRTSGNLNNYSGYIIMDIDHCGENVYIFKSSLKDDVFVHAVWSSPSADGLKFLIKTELDFSVHKEVYSSAVGYFNEKYNMNIDTSGSDLARLCYVSYDPDLYLNENAHLYNERFSEVLILNKNETDKKIIDEQDKHIHHDKINFKNKSFDKDRLKKIYHYLKKRGFSITKTYEDWVRVAFAISNSFNYDFGHKWFLEIAKLDGQKYDELESVLLINNCYRSGLSKSSFGTIIYLAQKQGYNKC